MGGGTCCGASGADEYPILEASLPASCACLVATVSAACVKFLKASSLSLRYTN